MLPMWHPHCFRHRRLCAFPSRRWCSCRLVEASAAVSLLLAECGGVVSAKLGCLLVVLGVWDDCCCLVFVVCSYVACVWLSLFVVRSEKIMEESTRHFSVTWKDTVMYYTLKGVTSHKRQEAIADRGTTARRSSAPQPPG